MSDVSLNPQDETEEKEVKTDDGGFDPVCVDMPRIYDSCGAKDCLRDLTVFFTAENQEAINNATSARVSKASVISSTLKVDSLAFNRGFYSVDIVFYFAVCVELYSGAAVPSTVMGLAAFNKRVVLYGSDGSTRSFSSDDIPSAIDAAEFNCCPGCPSVLPRATVSVSCPMVLASSLAPVTSPQLVPFVPENVSDFFGGELVAPETQYLSVTLGVFSITRLSRSVQLMIPSYDFFIPAKECEDRTDDPCEAFSRVDFPTDSFFPPACGDGEQGGGSPSFGCGCS